MVPSGRNPIFEGNSSIVINVSKLKSLSLDLDGKTMLKKSHVLKLLKAPPGSAPDDRKTVPWEELGEEIHLLIKRSSDGSLEGLQALVAWMELSKLTARQDRLVPILFRYLEKDPPHDISSGPGLVKAKYAAAALEGVLQSFLWQASVDKVYTSVTFQYFDRFWTSVWKWMIALHSRISSPTGLFGINDAPATDSDISLTIRRLLFTVCARDTGMSKILKTPGITTLLVGIWVLLSEMTSLHSSDMNTWTTVMTCLSGIMERNQWLEVIDSMGGLPQFATLLLKTLRIFRQVNLATRPSTPIVILLSLFPTLSVPKLGNELLAQHSMIEMMHTFAAYADNIPSYHNEMEHCYLVIWSCLLYVQSTSTIADGFTWVTQAVRSRLIQSMIKSIVSLRGVDSLSNLSSLNWNELNLETMQQQIILILSLLSNFLSYRSLTREVERVLADPQTAKFEERIPRDGNFWNAWVKFKAYVEDRARFRHDFDKAEKYSQSCSASDCENKESTRYFKLCAGCQISPYCSKACQARDWKSGVHKEFCRKIRADRAAGTPMRISEIDYQFLQYTAGRDITQHQVRLASARAAVFRQGKAKDCIIFVDYTGASGAPLAFVLDVPENIPKYQDTPLPGHWRPGMSEPVRTHLVVRVAHGHVHQQYSFNSSDEGKYAGAWLDEMLGAAAPRPGALIQRDQMESKLPFYVRVDRYEEFDDAVHLHTPWLLFP